MKQSICSLSICFKLYELENFFGKSIIRNKNLRRFLFALAVKGKDFSVFVCEVFECKWWVFWTESKLFKVSNSM